MTTAASNMSAEAFEELQNQLADLDPEIKDAVMHEILAAPTQSPISVDTSGDAPARIVHDYDRGTTRIYSTLDDKPSDVLRVMLAKYMKETLPDGRPAWYMLKPGEPSRWKEGELVCPLHKDSPERKLFDAAGLPYCSKGGIRTEYAREMHMERRHPNSWAVWQRMKESDRRTEEAAGQQDLHKLLAHLVGNVPHTIPCMYGRCDFIAESMLLGAAKVSMQAHIRAKHKGEIPRDEQLEAQAAEDAKAAEDEEE